MILIPDLATDRQADTCGSCPACRPRRTQIGRKPTRCKAAKRRVARGGCRNLNGRYKTRQLFDTTSLLDLQACCTYKPVGPTSLFGGPTSLIDSQACWTYKPVRPTSLFALKPVRPTSLLDLQACSAELQACSTYKPVRRTYKPVGPTSLFARQACQELHASTET